MIHSGNLLLYAALFKTLRSPHSESFETIESSLNTASPIFMMQPGATQQAQGVTEVTVVGTEGEAARGTSPGMAERAMEVATGVLHTVEDLAAGVYHSGKKCE